MAWVDSMVKNELLYEEKNPPCKKVALSCIKIQNMRGNPCLLRKCKRLWLIQKQNCKTYDIWKWRISVKEIKQTNNKKEKIFKIHKTNKELLKINRAKSNDCKRKLGKLILGSLRTMHPQTLSYNRWCLNSLMYREM